MSYQEFLESKLSKVQSAGFDPESLPSFLFPYQRHIVKLALNKGKFAVFAGTGLGKTAMQLSWAKAVAQYTQKPVLILAPLAVAKQTAYDESAKFGVDCQYCESQDDVIDGINITNYQKLDKFDVSIFSGVVLDESSILKSFTGAIRNQLIDSFQNTPYRLACSATPSPNDHMELGNHAEFLGIMSRTEMLAQYFIHDSGDVSKWRLKKHAHNPFWGWLAQWSIMLQKPSDIGFSDDDYSLPPLNECFLKVASGVTQEGQLFVTAARGLTEQRAAKKSTLDLRVEKIAALVNDSDEQWLIWCETNDESAAIKKAIADAVEVKGSDKDSHKEDAAFEFAHKKIRVLVSKPSIYGFGMNWQNCRNVAFVGLSNSFEMTYQAIRRCYRFGQTRSVNVYFVETDLDGALKANMQRKQNQFEEMMENLLVHTEK
jgi:superfamily II DNA or RNA helicase